MGPRVCVDTILRFILGLMLDQVEGYSPVKIPYALRCPRMLKFAHLKCGRNEQM
jgi:hypothetical protein